MVELQTPELIGPAVVRSLGNLDRADRLTQRPSLGHHHVHLAQLGDDLLRRVSLSGHGSSLSVSPTSQVDPATGGRPTFTNTSSKCHRQREVRMPLTRLLRISAVNIGPKRNHQKRTVPWLTSIPRSRLSG
jgi:hypothetical protein